MGSFRKSWVVGNDKQGLIVALRDMLKGFKYDFGIFLVLARHLKK
jgi:hypothetical protein